MTGSRATLILSVAGLLCLIWTSGCVSTLFNRKNTAPSDKAGQTAPSLVRPRLADPKTSEGSPAAGAQEFDEPKKTASADRKGSESQQSQPARDAQKPEPVPAGGQGKTDKATEATDGKEAPKSSPSAVARTKTDTSWATPSGKAESGTAKETEEIKNAPVDPGKKHDHTKYVGIIKEKARETLAQHPGATYVRLCQDSTDDVWTLAVYKKEEKTYSRVYYAWDEVDQKWDKTYESLREPISRWAQHVTYSAARKACSDLKGSPE